MKIDYLGHSCFCITAENGTRVITDPYTKVGYELPKGIQADIITVSHQHFDHNYIDGVFGVSQVWTQPGEYIYNGIQACAISSYHDDKNGALRGRNLIFKLYIDGVTICHLGDLGEPCAKHLIDAIGEVDVLLLPIGGTYTIAPVQAKAYVSALQPKITIPMHYKPLDGAIDILPSSAFLSLYPNKGVYKPKASVCLTKETMESAKEEIIYMERI